MTASLVFHLSIERDDNRFRVKAGVFMKRATTRGGRPRT
jgi:hypothetical protein